MTSPDLPPPPPLAPPEGYVGYAPTNWGTGLRRVSGLAKADHHPARRLAIGQVITTATTPRPPTPRWSSSPTGDEDAFDDDLGAVTAGSSLTGAAQIAIIVLSIIWLYRVAANHRGPRSAVDVGAGLGDRRVVPPSAAVHHPAVDAPRVVEGGGPGRAARIAGLEAPGRFAAGVDLVPPLQHRADRPAPRSVLRSSGASATDRERPRRVLRRPRGPDHRRRRRLASSRRSPGPSSSARSPVATPQLTGEATQSMRLFVVRHVKAGDRSRWEGPDEERPASKTGRAPGRGDRRPARTRERVGADLVAVAALHPDPSSHSPTVSASRSRSTNDSPRIHHSRQSSPSSIDAPDRAVLCSHGDVIPELVEALVRRGMELTTARDWRKATLWVLEGSRRRRSPVHARRRRTAPSRLIGVFPVIGVPRAEIPDSWHSIAASTPMKKRQSSSARYASVSARRSAGGSSSRQVSPRRRAALDVAVVLGGDDREVAVRVGVGRIGVDRLGQLLARPVDGLGDERLVARLPADEQQQPAAVGQRFGVIGTQLEDLAVELHRRERVGGPEQPGFGEHRGDAVARRVAGDLLSGESVARRAGDEDAGADRHGDDRRADAEAPRTSRPGRRPAAGRARRRSRACTSAARLV